MAHEFFKFENIIQCQSCGKILLKDIHLGSYCEVQYEFCHMIHQKRMKKLKQRQEQQELRKKKQQLLQGQSPHVLGSHEMNSMPLSPIRPLWDTNSMVTIFPAFCQEDDQKEEDLFGDNHEYACWVG